MKGKNMYKTKQKSFIYDLLKQHKNQALSAIEIKKYCDDNNQNIGLSTIYRIVNNLCDENKLLKILRENKEAEYQLLHKDCNNHIHIKCEQCGEIVHLDDKSTKKIIKNLDENYHIKLSLVASTLMGLCNNCNK